MSGRHISLSGELASKGLDGGPIIDYEVLTFADLPDPLSVDLNDVYLVQTSTGVWPFKKRSGFYKSNGTEWVFVPESKFKETFETVSKNLRASNSSLSYFANGLLSQVVYANGVTKSFSYTDDLLTSVTLSGSTPSGINLTKNLTYTDGLLTDVGYS